MAVITFFPDVVGQNAPIDCTSTGATKIFEGGNDLFICPLFLSFETLEVDSVTETAIVSVGTNYPNYDNMLRAHGIKPEALALETIQLPSTFSFEGPVDIYVNVVRAASGTALTLIPAMGLFKHGIGV
jgi:hypothetical protein